MVNLESKGMAWVGKAIRQMVPLGFYAFLEVVRVCATPFGSNIASQKALEKAGFTLEAKLNGTLLKSGVVQDEWIFAVRRPGA